MWRIVCKVKKAEKLHRSRRAQVMVVKMDRTEEIQAIFWKRQGVLMKWMWEIKEIKGLRKPKFLASTTQPMLTRCTDRGRGRWLSRKVQSGVDTRHQVKMSNG